jgi:hypothetical protein
MDEFKESPPDTGGDSSGGKWQRAFIDEKPCKTTHSGQTKDGIAHGIGLHINPRKFSQYFGTFVNGIFHGYGVLHFGFFNNNYYEGEF